MPLLILFEYAAPRKIPLLHFKKQATLSARIPRPHQWRALCLPGVSAGLFNDLRSHSNAIKKVLDTWYTFMLFSPVFANQNPGLPVSLQLASPLVPSANHCPLITAH